MSTEHTVEGKSTSADSAFVPIVALLFGLAAGPAAWVAQLITNYALSSEACYPADQPSQVAPPPGWGGEHLLFAAINLACLILALFGLAVARSNWRRARRNADGQASLKDERSRFLGLCGMFTATGFAIAILFDAIAIWLVPGCWSILR